MATFTTTLSHGLGHKSEGKGTIGAGGLVWKIDLRSVGFTGFAPKQEQWGIHLKPSPLCFADKNVLIATFITRQDVTVLALRDQPNEALPLRLHGVFLDADSGIVRATKEWSITRPRGGVIPAGDGRFAVLTPALIALYSPSLVLVKDFKLSSEQQSNLWDFYRSPTGRSIVLEYHYPEASFQWIDTNSLQSRPAWSDSLSRISISDKELAFSRSPYLKSKGSTVHEVLIRPRDGPERTVCSVLAGQGDSCGYPELLSNETLALWTPHGFSVVPNVGGDAIIKASLHDDEWLGLPFHPSADGKRFAVTVWEHKGGNAFLDISFHNLLKRIVVYDLPSRQAVYALDAKGQKIKDVSGVALSPDGSLIAILADGVVEVYQVPSHE